jgi:predicted transposase YbfD/YdcC
LQRLDPDASDELAGDWAAQATMPGTGQRRVIAVDGKTLCGSAHGGEDGRHLLAALDHAHGAVLGQVDVGAKTNEIPRFSALLDRIDITGAVITADAMHAQRRHATYLAGRGAHYLFTVKRNQPALFTQLASLPWRQVPVAHQTRERGHGRAERRTIKVTAVAAGLAFPHAAQAIQIVRRRKLRGKKKWSGETVYAITSLTATQASPAELAAIIRGHWMIEDRLHWARDMDWDEDRSQIRTASAPQVMATLRNLVITILRLAGHTNIAAALRHHARRPQRPLQTIINC